MQERLLYKLKKSPVEVSEVQTSFSRLQAGLLFTEVFVTYSAATSSAGVAAASAAFASAFCFLCAMKRS